MDKEALVNAPDLQRYIVKDAKTTGVELGTGSYGSVLEFKISGASCAGKKLHDALLDTKGEGLKYMVDKFKCECQLLASLRHPNVVQFLGLAFLPESSLPCLLMERLYCSLDDYLETRRDIPFFIKRSILLDVSSGLMHLHEHDPPVIHRDLTSKNVLLTSSLTAKLADLGNSRFIDTNQLSSAMTTAPGTSVYMPPEAVQHNAHYNTELDIFSFGHLSLFVFAETFPCDLLPSVEPDPKNPDNIIPHTEVQRREKYFVIMRSKLSQKKHQPLINLVERCLHNAPGRRPTAQELYTSLEALPVDSDDYPTMEMKKISTPQMGHLERSLEVEEEEAQEKIGMLKRHRSAGVISRRWNTVILKISMGKYLQILRRSDKKIQDQVELSDIYEVKAAPGDLVFTVHFKDNTKPWTFSTLSEEERRSWIEGITYALQGRPLQFKEKEKGKDIGHVQGQDKSPLKSVYDIQNDVTLSPSSRARTLAFSLSPDTKRPDWTYGITFTPELNRRDWASHQPERETQSLTELPQYENARLENATPQQYENVFSFPASNEPLFSKSSSEQDEEPRHSFSHVMSTMANKASKFFEPQQVSLLMEMFQQLQEYIEPGHKEASSQSSSPNAPSDTADTTTKSTKYSPEEMLMTEEAMSSSREWPHWAKAALSVSGDMSLSEFEEDTLNILPSNLSSIEEMGDGQFGRVYKAILQTSEGKKIPVAMTVTKVCEMKDFKREMIFLSKMMHPNIVQFYGLVQEGEYAPAIAVEFLPQNNLKTFLMVTCAYATL